MLGWAQESQLWTSPCPRWYFNAFCSLGLLSRRKMCLHSLIHPTLIMHLGGRPWAGCFSSVQFSLSVVFNSLQAHRLQHARPLCPSPTPGVFSNSCPLSRWCHPTISSFVVPFSSCPQSFPASGSFQKSQYFESGSQSIGVSASASVLPMNIQNRFPLRWTGWMSLQFKGLSRVFSSTTVWKQQFFSTQPSLWSNTHMCTWLLKKSYLCQ